MTTYSYQYNLADGSLCAWGPDNEFGGDVPPADVLAASGRGVVSSCAVPLDHAHTVLGYYWDAIQRNVALGVPPILPRPVATASWIAAAFTPQEFDAIDASATRGQPSYDPQVRQIWVAIQAQPEINLANDLVALGLAFLVQKGLITAERASAVQNWTGVQ